MQAPRLTVFFNFDWRGVAWFGVVWCVFACLCGLKPPSLKTLELGGNDLGEEAEAAIKEL